MALPGYEGMSTFSYLKAGQWVRRRMDMTKWEHVAQADHYLKQASRLKDDYYRDVQDGLKMLASRGIDPGPLISGVVSGNFSDSFKDRLRSRLRHMNDLVDAAMGHYAAARKRIGTYQAAYHRYVGRGA